KIQKLFGDGGSRSVDPRPKAEVFSIANARQKLSEEP
ncbi:hypothetical protein ACVUVA_005883, partial [Klebsiella pneumoniae]